MKSLQHLCCLAASALFASTAALASPALWVARSPTATVYLFGTIHVLPNDVTWHYPALDLALAASDSLYVEEDDGSRAKIKALILKYGTSDSDRAAGANLFDRVYPHWDYVWKWHTLSSALGPADRERLRIAAERAGLPRGVATLDSMRPWLGALTLSVAATSRAGYEPQFGVDTELEREFKARGKPVHSFETTHDQIASFADTPPALQMDLLRSVIDTHVRGTTQIATLVRDWQAGKVHAIANVMDANLRDEYPELYRALIVTRNRNWAAQIEALLDGHRTLFVAVGAGHLAGPDSVQAQLAKLGIRTERVH
ncbi:MAG TPA: TraB/GumN family protein [Rhodanobacteraceae bacterium]|nr:TraB/GumN family protein [Rhodanobacteraceae bacterium]